MLALFVADGSMEEVREAAESLTIRQRIDSAELFLWELNGFERVTVGLVIDFPYTHNAFTSLCL